MVMLVVISNLDNFPVSGIAMVKRDVRHWYIWLYPFLSFPEKKKEKRRK